MKIRDIKEAVGVEEYLEYMGADVPPSGHGWSDWQALRCPFHDDSNDSASVNQDKGYFKCHACDAEGDIIDLVKLGEGLNTREAMEWISKNLM